MTNLKPTDRTTMSRLAKRASYDRQTIYSILDEALFCTLACTINNAPFQIPTGFVRIGDKLYIHGSVGSHFMRELAKGIPACISVTLLDGLVLARSAFHHSMNYRSVIVFGVPILIETTEEKNDMMFHFTNKIMPGRWDDTRLPYQKELDKTMVLAFDIKEASAKIRAAPVSDDEEDYSLPHWAGIIPIVSSFGKPEPDEKLGASVSLPAYISSAVQG